MKDQRTAGVPPADVAASRAATPGPAARRCRDSRRGRRRSTFFVLLVLLLFAFPLHATLTSSAITGRVIAGDAPAAGFTVTATSNVLQQPRTTVTGPRGTYWVGELPPGLYDVTFSRAGMTTLTRRAKVELGRVARADARLEPSEEEESVTSTATQTSVADTTAITSHFDDETLDRFPGRDYAAIIAPDAFYPTATEVDGVPFFAGIALPEEAIEQVTIIRAAAPVEYGAYGGRVMGVRTRSGREQYFLSLRDTLSNDAWNDGGPFRDDDGVQNLFEAHGGGRIVPRRLWFFASLWSGDDATRFTRNQRGGQVKLHAQPGAAHHLEAMYLAGENGPRRFSRGDAWTAALRYTGAFGPRYTTETLISRSSAALSLQPPAGGPPSPSSRDRLDFLSSRASYALPARGGDHVLTAGLEAWSSPFFDAHSFHVSDRWSASRWVLNAGVRYEDAPLRDGDFTPRVAVTYDLRGDGTRALSASWGEYSFGPSSASPVRVATLGYAAAIGNSGTARADLLRRDGSFGHATNSLQLDTRYRLFDRFEAGATYTYTSFDDDDDLVAPVSASHNANAWIGAQLPIGAHEFGVTLLQRYFEFYNPGTVIDADSAAPTDVALRYAIPLSRVGLMFAIDAANVFGAGQSVVPRTVRFWTRLRV